MFIILRKDWEVLDGSKSLRMNQSSERPKIAAGRHEVERIPNPYGFEGSFWLVLKGTKIGAGEESWRQWTNYDNEFKVVIEE